MASTQQNSQKTTETSAKNSCFDCNSVGLVQGTKTPQNRKCEKNTKYKSPTLGWAPKIRKNFQKKYKNGPKMTIFVFFRVFFFIFSGPNPGWGICNFFVFFSYFRPWAFFFVPCTSPTELQCFDCFGCFSVAAPFLAVCRLFSKSSVWHLSRWQQRLHSKGP